MSGFPAFPGAFVNPGIKSTLETPENQFWWGHWTNQKWINANIDSTAADAGNTGATTVLRAGLVLGRVTSTGKLKQWNIAATDGTQFVYGILGISLKMTDATGTAQENFIGKVMVGGNVKTSNVILPGESSVGISGNELEYIFLTQATHGGRFLFDTPVEGMWNMDQTFESITATPKTLAVTDSGKTFLQTFAGATTINLPLAQPGLVYRFFNMVDQDMIIDSNAADTIVGLDDAAADTVTYSTASSLIGAACEVYAHTSTQWLFRSLSNNVYALA